jgi:NaMN:DMB phosphoribosyltransferase
MKDVKFKISLEARPWWFTSVIPATQEAEIRKLAVQGQPWQIVHETPSPK